MVRVAEASMEDIIDTDTEEQRGEVEYRTRNINESDKVT